jgi:hypothetical protein
LRERKDIEALYRQRLRLVIRRFERNRVYRSTAEKLKISHPTIAKILKDPDRLPSLKIMMKIIKATTPKILSLRIDGRLRGRIPGCPK